MEKNTKLILGVGVLAAAGYLIWKQNQKPATASFMRSGRMAPARFKVVQQCVGTTGKILTDPELGPQCANGCYDCCQMGYVTPNKPSQGCGPTQTQM